MERKKRSKGRGWESCHVKKNYVTFGVEMRAYGQKLVQFCKHTHTRVSYSSIDVILIFVTAVCPGAICWCKARILPLIDDDLLNFLSLYRENMKYHIVIILNAAKSAFVCGSEH